MLFHNICAWHHLISTQVLSSIAIGSLLSSKIIPSFIYLVELCCGDGKRESTATGMWKKVTILNLLSTMETLFIGKGANWNNFDNIDDNEEVKDEKHYLSQWQILYENDFTALHNFMIEYIQGRILQSSFLESTFSSADNCKDFLERVGKLNAVMNIGNYKE